MPHGVLLHFSKNSKAQNDKFITENGRYRKQYFTSRWIGNSKNVLTMRQYQ